MSHHLFFRGTLRLDRDHTAEGRCRAKGERPFPLTTTKVQRLLYLIRGLPRSPAYGIGVANLLGIDVEQFIPRGAVQSEGLIGKH